MSVPMQGLNDGAGRVAGLTTMVAAPGSFSVALRLARLRAGSYPPDSTRSRSRART